MHEIQNRNGGLAASRCPVVRDDFVVERPMGDAADAVALSVGLLQALLRLPIDPRETKAADLE